MNKRYSKRRRHYQMVGLFWSKHIYQTEASYSGTFLLVIQPKISQKVISLLSTCSFCLPKNAITVLSPKPRLQMTSGCFQKSNLDSADEDLWPWKTLQKRAFLKSNSEEKGTRAEEPRKELKLWKRAGLER